MSAAKAASKNVKPRTTPKRAPVVSIPITDKNIKRATRNDSSHCMIADSIIDALPNAKFVSVDLQTIRWSDLKTGFRYTYLTPRPAQEALILFDRGVVPPPFTLKLRGAQTSSVQRVARGKGGKRTFTRQHKLGRRKLIKAATSSGVVPDIVGGKPPMTAELASHSKGTKRGNLPRGNRRQFGLRAFTLDDVLPDATKPPTTE